MDLGFLGFVANLKLDCVAETIRTEIGQKSRTSKKICQKGALTLKVTFWKVRFDVVWSLWIDHVTIFQ